MPKSSETMMLGKIGQVIEDKTGRYECLVKDGTFARCLSCGTPVHTLGKGFDSVEHRRVCKNFSQCVTKSDAQFVLTYEQFRLGLDLVKSKVTHLRKQYAPFDYEVLKGDLVYSTELMEILDLSYDVFYSSGLWVQNWDTDYVISREDYKCLLWNTPRFRAWVSSFMPVEYYVALCTRYWADRALRCVYCFKDVPFLTSRIIPSPFEPSPLLADVTEGTPKVVREALTDVALLPRPSGMFNFDRECVPAAFAFNRGLLKEAQNRVQSLSGGSWPFNGNITVEKPRSLTHLDSRLFAV